MAEADVLKERQAPVIATDF